MLAHRLRRWPNIRPTLDQQLGLDPYNADIFLYKDQNVLLNLKS